MSSTGSGGRIRRALWRGLGLSDVSVDDLLYNMTRKNVKLDNKSLLRCFGRLCFDS